MSLGSIGAQFPIAAECIASFCGAAEALCLSRSEAAWFATLSRPQVWRRYLFGSAHGLVRPILTDSSVAALFGSDLVHPKNHRAAVAALSSSRWWCTYTAMKRALVAGRLSAPLRNRCRAKRAKLDFVRSVKQVKTAQKQQAKRHRAGQTAVKQRVPLKATRAPPFIEKSALPAPAPSTPKRAQRVYRDRSLSPPRPTRPTSDASGASTSSSSTSGSSTSSSSSSTTDSSASHHPPCKFKFEVDRHRTLSTLAGKATGHKLKPTLVGASSTRVQLCVDRHRNPLPSVGKGTDDKLKPTSADPSSALGQFYRKRKVTIMCA